MAAFVQVEEGNLTNGSLPPLKELFLEIQIQKLIHEYLFSSNAGELCSLLPEEPPKHKQINKAAECMNTADAALQSAHDAPFVKSTEPFDGDHKQSPNDPGNKSNSQASPTLHSITFIDQDCGMHGIKDQTIIPDNALLVTANGAHGASLTTTLSVESGGKVVHKTAHLGRGGTFPCAGNAQLQVGVPSEVKLEIKTSCKKPPRPPNRLKSELSQSLMRCNSENGAYLQSIARRERKRKATATTMATSASDMASILAVLLFTLCFATIMIAQGSDFWSQNSQNFSAYDGGDVSSPSQTFMKASTKPSAEEDSNLAEVAERQANMEGFSTEREAASSGKNGLAQSYVVVRKVLLQLPYSYKALRT